MCRQGSQSEEPGTPLGAQPIRTEGEIQMRCWKRHEDGLCGWMWLYTHCGHEFQQIKKPDVCIVRHICTQHKAFHRCAVFDKTLYILQPWPHYYLCAFCLKIQVSVPIIVLSMKKFAGPLSQWNKINAGICLSFSPLRNRCNFFFYIWFICEIFNHKMTTIQYIHPHM